MKIEPVALPIAVNPLLAPTRTVSRVEEELTKLPHLAADRRYSRRAEKTRVAEARQSATAFDALGGQLPGDGESLHVMISGRFALFDFVPAVSRIAGGIDRLTIATLGFSRRNIVRLCEMYDDGRVAAAKMLFSHYFRGTSSDLTTLADEEFAKRPGLELLSVRTHAKMLLFRLADGRRVTMESSANMRSCGNIEQVSVFVDAGLHDFHEAWIDELFEAAK